MTSAVVPSFLARFAARLLPSWCRDRYEVEFGAELAELAELPHLAQWRHAAGLVLVAPALRIAVLRGAAVRAGFPHPTVGCLLGVRHRWHHDYTDDGERYVRCSRCGIDSSRGQPGRLGVVPPFLANPPQ